MNELPEGWAWSVLDDLVAAIDRPITDGPFGSNLKTAHYTDEGPRVIRLQNIGDGEFIDARAHISQEHFESLRPHAVEAGDLVVASLGSDLPRSCLVPEHVGPAIVKADCIRVRLHPEIDSRFVSYALQRPSLRKATQEEIHGVGRPRIGMKGVRGLSVPVPPLPEQRRIVAAIEEHFSRLDAAEASVRTSMKRCDQMLAALRADAFRRDWPRKAVRSVAETGLGKMLSAKSKTGVGTTPYLRNKNVRWGSVDIHDVAEMDFTDEEREKFRLLPGDVLICEGGAGVGRTAIWRGELEMCCFQKALHRVRTGDDLLPEFLAHYFRYFWESKLLEQQLSGVAIGHFPQEDLRSLEIPIPPLDAQRHFIDEFSNQMFLTEALQNTLEIVAARTNSLRRSILAAAFAGRLVPQDPSDEPASVLLERIAAERAAAQPSRRKNKAAS